MLVFTRLRGHGSAIDGYSITWNDPCAGEEDKSINATGTEILIVIKRKYACASIRFAYSTTPNLVLDLSR